MYLAAYECTQLWRRLLFFKKNKTTISPSKVKLELFVQAVLKKYIYSNHFCTVKSKIFGLKQNNLWEQHHFARKIVIFSIPSTFIWHLPKARKRKSSVTVSLHPPRPRWWVTLPERKGTCQLGRGKCHQLCRQKWPCVGWNWWCMSSVRTEQDVWKLIFHIPSPVTMFTHTIIFHYYSNTNMTTFWI